MDSKTSINRICTKSRHKKSSGQILMVNFRILSNLSLLLNLLVPIVIESSEALINVTSFHVPASARVGETRRLRCAYKLNGGETLHAMKLFKDDKEFYRYSPGASDELDRKMVFPMAGVKVDLKRSDERDVVLKSLTKQSAGLYRCQVSVEGTFKSISAEKRMEVSDTIAPWNQLAGGGAEGQAAVVAATSAGADRQHQRQWLAASSVQLSNHGVNSNNIASSSLQAIHQRQLGSNFAPSKSSGSSVLRQHRAGGGGGGGGFAIQSVALSSSILITLMIFQWAPRVALAQS